MEVAVGHPTLICEQVLIMKCGSALLININTALYEQETVDCP